MRATHLLSEGLAAHARGWVMTPLTGKRPMLDSWQSRPVPTKSDVRAWVAAGHNLGLRTGPISGVLVVDHDPRHDDGTPLPLLPVTVTVNTGGGGTHRYYRCPSDPPPNSAGKLHPALDVKSLGGQVVFVGSVHPETGRTYAWASGLEPDGVPMADVPPELLARMRVERMASATAQPAPLPHLLGTDERIRRARAYLARVPGGVSGEGGSRPCFRAACVLIHGFGLSQDEAFALLLTEYSPRCTPPWNERDLRHKVSDAAKQQGASGFALMAQRTPPAWATEALARPSPARIVLPRHVSAAMVQLLTTGRHSKYTERGGALDLQRAVFGASISLLRAGMSRSAVTTALAASALRPVVEARGPDALFWLVGTVERAERALAQNGVAHA